ncbi:FeoB-associated Cys-rich membrane protein [Reichenbachiella ulvae]|uniref:FeoB-associated Cys-rich membrane protein n=1 Tax=Reichenbachiella ulvae TaxID=2980104 RepID=A0ABT3D080_9BACT|nr:FeoB-associated Cys-rich membrane protein [Reichenbachiella ulvae]MCV9389221.1 FeoB-associated Cys-rich membrane protein [Reichenbachiella ulvae]
MIQNILVILLFLAAIGYIARRYLFKSPKDTGCAKGCNNCGEAQQQ